MHHWDDQKRAKAIKNKLSFCGISLFQRPERLYFDRAHADSDEYREAMRVSGLCQPSVDMFDNALTRWSNPHIREPSEAATGNV